ncbi:unnamed protein product [Peniophora sp. CBMAI 1063]|nr:unnamed protein product [Peniophora sp. CBMAI 1063]
MSSAPPHPTHPLHLASVQAQRSLKIEVEAPAPSNQTDAPVEQAGARGSPDRKRARRNDSARLEVGGQSQERSRRPDEQSNHTSSQVPSDNPARASMPAPSAVNDDNAIVELPSGRVISVAEMLTEMDSLLDRRERQDDIDERTSQRNQNIRSWLHNIEGSSQASHPSHPSALHSQASARASQPPTSSGRHPSSAHGIPPPSPSPAYHAPSVQRSERSLRNGSRIRPIDASSSASRSRQSSVIREVAARLSQASSTRPSTPQSSVSALPVPNPGTTPRPRRQQAFGSRRETPQLSPTPLNPTGGRPQAFSTRQASEPRMSDTEEEQVHFQLLAGANSAASSDTEDPRAREAQAPRAGASRAGGVDSAPFAADQSMEVDDGELDVPPPSVPMEEDQPEQVQPPSQQPSYPQPPLYDQSSSSAQPQPTTSAQPQSMPSAQPQSTPSAQPQPASSAQPQTTASAQSQPAQTAQQHPGPPSPSATAIPSHQRPSQPNASASMPTGGNDAYLLGLNSMSYDIKAHTTKEVSGVSARVDSVEKRIDQRIDHLESVVTRTRGGRGRGGRAPAPKPEAKKKADEASEDKMFSEHARLTNAPQKMDAERTALLKVVRLHLAAIFDRQGMDKFGEATDPELVRDVHLSVDRMTRDAKGRHIRSLAAAVQTAPIPRPLQGAPIDIDYDYSGAGPITSGYNQVMAKLFLEDFFSKPEHKNYDKDEIRDMFLLRIKNLKRERTLNEEAEDLADDHNIPVEEVDRQLKDVGLHDGRRRRNFKRRLSGADGIPEDVDPKKVVQTFVQQLGLLGASDDEDRYVKTRNNKTVKKRVVKILGWRHPAVRPILTDVEELYDMLYSRDGMLSQDKRGQMPEAREFYEGENIDWDAPAPPHLPRNAYNPVWLAMKGQAYVDTVVQPHPKDFVIPPGFRPYYLRVLKAWQDRHPVQPHRTYGPSQPAAGPSAPRSSAHPQAPDPGVTASPQPAPGKHAAGKRKADAMNEPPAS